MNRTYEKLERAIHKCGWLMNCNCGFRSYETGDTPHALHCPLCNEIYTIKHGFPMFGIKWCGNCQK